jgi:non-heme chloroperoxidase
VHRRDPPAALTDRFDPLGPSVHRAAVATGRTVRFIDEGEAGWQSLLWFGGAGTSVRAFRLLEFAHSLREHLRIRVLSVERNGLGESPFDETLGPAEHAADVWALLDARGVSTVSLMAISGGGPYAAHVAAAAPGRVRSLHLACAYTDRLAGAALPSPAALAADPPGWWRYPDASPVHQIPGFVASVAEEAALSGFWRDGDEPPPGLLHAFSLYAEALLPDLAEVSAPAFLYWGSDDELVPQAHLERWRAALPNVQEVRLYEGEGHDVQYRHWDQVLADVAFLGEQIVVSHGGRTSLVDPQRADELVAAGGALGLAAWHR